ncbi:exonuclease domain-containing protein [Streptomyces hesseae]|uniref:Exonuclease domain-containing protein n=1 Tax=Streptomyces hesseae TaxID=3075519 RepID=A0ABU2SM64_9ACTN|nr:exonuclease domain-containing protein [Streptomyces sp. DSM 40473]MDT0450077.1 exonuclease domain-containing protein [Streptomyces sp. DSM 40473]
MSWHEERLVGFDLETTGTDPSTARIVTAAVVETKGGEVVASRSWLADPGTPIPAETTAIHGITTERAADCGRPAREVAEEVATALAGHWSMGVPVVAYNAAFDLSLLSAELGRYGLRSLSERLDERLGGDGAGAPAAAVGPVVDPLTIDRAVDRFRKGRRTLAAACGEYGVVLDGAHEAGADALAAVRVARAIAERYEHIAAADLWELHRDQERWYGEWAAGYQKWLRRQGNPEAVVEGAWPLR